MTVRVGRIASGMSAEDHRLATQIGMAPAGALQTRSGLILGAVTNQGTGSPADLQTVSAMQAKVVPFQAWVDGTSATLQSGYSFTSDADVTLLFADGDATNPRIDLVVARIRDNPYDASGVQLGDVVIIQGTPAASPTAPAVPASSLALWEVRVEAGRNAGNGGIDFPTKRTNRRLYTSALGGGITIYGTSVIPANPHDGMKIYDYSADEEYVFDGGSFQPIGAKGQLLTFTPLLTAVTTNPTLGSGSTATMEYRMIFYNTVWFYGVIQFGSSPTAGSGFYSISLPLASASSSIQVEIGPMKLFDASTTEHKTAVGDIFTSSNKIDRIRFNGTASEAGSTVAHNAPWTWASGDSIRFSGIYRVA